MLSVSDKGIGIPPADLEPLFTPFFRASNAVGAFPDAHFRRRGPVRPGSNGDQRFRSVLSATRRDVTLPPIAVFQIGFGYYVEDGHHRVAAARLNGQTEIDADVTEFVSVDDERTPEVAAARLALDQLPTPGKGCAVQVPAQTGAHVSHGVEECRRIEQPLALGQDLALTSGQLVVADRQPLTRFPKVARSMAPAR